MAKFYSTKTYGNDRGLSCCFRQWRSRHSACSLLHGYSIGVRVVFECDMLYERNWVHDFGGLKKFKKWLDYMFDHTTLIAVDDPHLEFFKQMNNMVTINRFNDIESPIPNERGAICDIRIVPAVGCERFAEMAYNKLSEMLDEDRRNGALLNPTVRVKSVEVFEHGANSAIYEG